VCVSTTNVSSESQSRPSKLCADPTLSQPAMQAHSCPALGRQRHPFGRQVHVALLQMETGKHKGVSAGPANPHPDLLRQQDRSYEPHGLTCLLGKVVELVLPADSQSETCSGETRAQLPVSKGREREEEERGRVGCLNHLCFPVFPFLPIAAEGVRKKPREQGS
jgi:hypothetical protein